MNAIPIELSRHPSPQVPQRTEDQVPWTKRETAILLELVAKEEDWGAIATRLPSKTPQQCAYWFDYLERVSRYFPRSQRLRNPIQQRRRRKAAQIERLYRCQEKFCNRSYGTEGALKMHIKLKHPSVTYNENYQLQARRAAAILNQKLLEDDEEEEDSYEDPKYNHYLPHDSDSHYNRFEEDEELQFEIFGNHFPTSKKTPSLSNVDTNAPAHLLAPLEFDFKKSDGFEKLNLPQIEPPHTENPQKLKRSLSELCQMSNSKRLKSDPPTFEPFPKGSHANAEYERFSSTASGFQFPGLPPPSSDSHRHDNTGTPMKHSSIQSFQQSFRVPQENKTINPMQIHYLV